jgi:hypothetical protein
VAGRGVGFFDVWSQLEDAFEAPARLTVATDLSDRSGVGLPAGIAQVTPRWRELSRRRRSPGAAEVQAS